MSAKKETGKTFQPVFDYAGKDVILSVRHLKQYFPFKTPESKYLKAVHDVSFDVYRGEVFGLVGESGCGKTTTGRDIMRLYKITSGDIWLDGIRISAGTRWNEKEIKFANLRAKKAIGGYQSEKQKILAQFKKDYAKQFKSAAPLWVLKGEFSLHLSSDKDLDKKKALYEAYLKKIAPFDELIVKEREKARGICSIQSDKIRSARRDNRQVNKRIAENAVKQVDEKYAALLSSIQEKAPEQFTSEELAAYDNYKNELSKAKHANLANKVQMIFQDPIASLNPRMTVRSIISEGLQIQGGHSKKEINEQVERVLKLVGLVPEHANRYPHEFSGGQRQRIGIARSIIMNPELIVADEPVSALDVSVQAQVINLLNDLRNSMGLAIIFIAHNLSVVKYFCDRIAVMYYGNLVEMATSDELFKHPLHPYTVSLLSAVPYPDPVTEATRKRIIYDPSKSHDYSKQKPTFRELVPGHFVYCNDEEAAKYLAQLKGEK